VRDEISKVNTWLGFGTSISPWVITLDALKPFACEPKHDHSATEFKHLTWKDRATGTFDIRLAASLILKPIFLTLHSLGRDLTS
jgi:hypothetical protein